MARSKAALLALVAFWTVWSGRAVEAQSVVVQHFPQRDDVEILCWSVPEEGVGFISEIVVIQTTRKGISRLLWQSQLDNSYSPEIRFMPEISVEGLPLALVERKTGAASAELDVIGQAGGRVVRLDQIDGFQFDVVHLDSGKLPYVVAHRDASILDVPEIYRWNVDHFVEDSASHPDYFRRLLVEDRQKIAGDASGAVMVKLSRIAELSGDRTAARRILEDALRRERARGEAANKETLRLILDASRSLEQGSQQPRAR